MSLLGPDKDQLSAIRSQINESPERMQSNLALLRQWVQCQPHLPQHLDDQLAMIFLRGCKHNLERTKQKLDVYFSVRGAVPELFSKRDPLSKDIQQAMEVMHAYPLPQLTPDGSRVTVHHITTDDVALFNLQAILRTQLMLGDVRIQEESPISGDIFLFDLSHFRAGHCTTLTASLPLLREALSCVQEAYPQRLKQIHIIHAQPFIDKLVNLFKAFMKEKMRNRFYVHSSVKSLHQYIPADILPVKYGGDCDKDLQAEWCKKLESYRSWFAEQEHVRTDESRRPIKSFSSNRDMFGCEGSFRKLSID
ncbi:clavesin-2 [Anabrus simplex]|uniref:clavesin-2 n=1 Tax=Anabrus simplex TaxID=316456 RepID=UPI0035A2E7AD